MKKVLIVEDDSELCDLISDTLEGFGFLCSKAKDFDSGKKQIEENLFNFYFIDICLHEKSGIDLVHLIKKNKSAKIVISSGSIDEKVKLECGQVWKYCPKPYNLFNLASEMVSVIEYEVVSAV